MNKVICDMLVEEYNFGRAIQKDWQLQQLKQLMEVVLNGIIIERIQFGNTFWRVIHLEIPFEPMPHGLKALCTAHTGLKHSVKTSMSKSARMPKMCEKTEV